MTAEQLIEDIAKVIAAVDEEAPTDSPYALADHYDDALDRIDTLIESWRVLGKRTA